MSLPYSNPTGFENLPSEIKCNILKHISDLESLRALIGASPCYFQAYRVSKRNVLSELAWNSITPDLIPIALDAHQMREKYSVKSRRDRADILKYLKQDFLRPDSPRPELRERVLPLQTSKALLRFHEIVEYFVSDFATDRLGLIGKRTRSSDGTNSPENDRFYTSTGSPFAISKNRLSRTEHFRLARAFYYLELYAQLFNPASSDRYEISSSEQSTLFLQRLQDFELEELLCVSKYFIDNISTYMDQLEDEYMDDFLENELERMKDRAYDTSRWADGDWFFSDEGRYVTQDHWAEECLVHGLEILKIIFTKGVSDYSCDSDDDEGEEEVEVGSGFIPLHHIAGIGGQVLRNALDSTPQYPDQPLDTVHAGTSPLFEGFRDERNAPNLAWLYVLEQDRHPRCHMNYAENQYLQSLGRWGYTIWDSDRLLSFGFIGRRIHAFTKQFVGLSRDRNRPTVEKRCREQFEIWKREGVIPPEPPKPQGRYLIYGAWFNSLRGARAAGAY